MMGEITDGAIASFSDEQGSFMDRAHTVEQGQGLATDLGPSTIGMTPGQLNEHFSGLPSAVQQTASPGLVGRGLSLAAGVLGSPVAGLAVDTGARALDASKQIGQVNDDFGTTFNEGFGNSFGQQAVGAVGGLAGSKAGGLIGGRLGAALGPVGAVAGTLAGSMTGKSFGRDLAMGGFDGDSPGATDADGGYGYGDGGYGDGSDAIMMAGTNPAQAGRPAAQTNTAPSRYGPVGLTRYASYAQSFFT
jgi:hypothetical protein